MFDTRNLTPELYWVRMTREQVWGYLDNMPPIELEDGRLITLKDWVQDYISRGIDRGIRDYFGWSL
jgi:hypothetical protein